MWACRPTRSGESVARIAGLFGRIYNPPLRHAIDLVRRAGCPHPAKSGCRSHRAGGHRTPAMAACGHAALRDPAGVRRESRACSGGYKIRPYDTPSTWSVGAAISRPDRTTDTVRRAGCPHPAKPGCRNHRAGSHRTPATAACGHAALRGPAGVRRESRACSGGYKIRPYDAPSTWSVGRGAHTPPMQAAATTGLAIIAPLPRRHVGMPPYEVRRKRGGNRGPVRADI